MLGVKTAAAAAAAFGLLISEEWIFFTLLSFSAHVHCHPLTVVLQCAKHDPEA